MLTGTIRNQVDQIWNAFWSGGVSNPLSVIEQLTFLMFIKRLDDLHTLEERKAEDLSQPMQRRIFPVGADDKGEPYDTLRWSRFKNFEAREMMRIVDEHVFPFLRQLGEAGSSYGTHMKDARLGFSNPNLLAKPLPRQPSRPLKSRCRRWRSRSGLRGYWMRRRGSAASAPAPSTNSTPSANPSFTRCSAAQMRTSRSGLRLKSTNLFLRHRSAQCGARGRWEKTSPLSISEWTLLAPMARLTSPNCGVWTLRIETYQSIPFDRVISFSTRATQRNLLGRQLCFARISEASTTITF